MQRWLAIYDHVAKTGDWDPVRAICSPALVFEDRRRLFLLSGGIDLMIVSAAERMVVGARPRLELLGTAGDRIAIERVLWSGGPADGPFEIEYLGLWEVDEGGQLITMLLFDADEAPTVQREAWRRWAAIEPALADTLAMVAKATDAFNAQDRAGYRAQCADDLVVEDHRRIGMGHIRRKPLERGRIEGGDAYVDSLVALWQLAAAVRVEHGWFWPAIAPNGSLHSVRRTGDVAGGGVFGSDYLMLALHAHGRFTRVELFELDDLDKALARFGDLHEGRGAE